MISSLSRCRRPMMAAGGRAAAHLARPAASAAFDEPKVAWFSTKTNTPSSEDHLGEWQNACWQTYLSSGRGSDVLFRAIDAKKTGTLTVQDLRLFLDSIGHKGVHPRAFKLVDELAHDHQITLKEFKSWLIIATKFACQRNSSYALDYESSPHLGERAKKLKLKKDQIEALKVEAESDHEDAYHSWNEVTMSQSVRRMQYAVRGQVVMRAEALQAQGKEILFTNVGNPHSVGQKPITFFRQVLALADLPAEMGIDHPDVGKMFPPDAVARAKEVQNAIGGSGTGAYTTSQGILEFRKDVASFIENRDGHKSYPGNIFLTNGASTAIELVLTTMLASDLDAVMIPIPQYPIYSALVAKLGGRQVGYELDESKGWSATLDELQKRWEEAKEDGLDLKALVIINPGNPTGQVYSREDLEIICKFCAQNGLVLLADEVYQQNVYAEGKEFISAKKVAMETPGCESLQVVSFHSTSKGLLGECGRRGGYMECHNIDSYVQSQLYKLASSGLCSNVPGQIMMSLMVKPPQEGDESYDQFQKEEREIFDGLKRRSSALAEALNKVDGIKCNPAEGAMYCFPEVEIPQGAIDEAERQHTTPDTLYALSLLEETGICVVPGSGFGQRAGRVGFRTTFLPPDEKMLDAIGKFESHHKNFCAKYAD